MGTAGEATPADRGVSRRARGVQLLPQLLRGAERGRGGRRVHFLQNAVEGGEASVQCRQLRLRLGQLAGLRTCRRRGALLLHLLQGLDAAREVADDLLRALELRAEV